MILTASGGPFRNRADLSDVTVADALNHPTWSMGEVVTINSATLLNKGLEIIEAHYLFGLDYENIEAVIHPQSVVHSLVEYVDGSTIAQASPPNMKGPIAYALSYPERIAIKQLRQLIGVNLTLGSFPQLIMRSIQQLSWQNVVVRWAQDCLLFITQQMRLQLQHF